MSKIFIKAFLENITEKEHYHRNTIGILKDNQIQYMDDTIHMIIHLEEDKIYMKRIQKDACLECTFQQSLTTNGIYDIKSVNMILNVKINTKKLTIQKESIEIEYEMSISNEQAKKFYYQLKYEVIK